MGIIHITDVIRHDKYSQFAAVGTTAEAVNIGKVAFQAGARIPAEGYAAHEEDEYVCILKGEILFGTEQETYPLHAGDFHHMPKGVRHWCQNADSGQGELLYVLVKCATAGVKTR